MHFELIFDILIEHELSDMAPWSSGQDASLSRWNQGFDSPWSHFFKVLKTLKIRGFSAFFIFWKNKGNQKLKERKKVMVFFWFIWVKIYTKCVRTLCCSVLFLLVKFKRKEVVLVFTDEFLERIFTSEEMQMQSQQMMYRWSKRGKLLLKNKLQVLAQKVV